MEIYIKNKKLDIIECNSFLKKLRGLTFKKDIHKGIILNHCNGIHTFFMKSNIDVILLDKSFNILYLYSNLKRRRIVLPKKDVYYTIELPPNVLNNIKKEEIKIKN